MMAKPHTLHLWLVGAHIASALGTMYEAYTIEPAGFVVNMTEQTTQFMCSVNAGRNGHTAFRISNDTGKCEMGNITANVIQSPNGIMVYVKSGIIVKSCVILPTIDTHYYSYDNNRFPVSATLVDNQKDSDSDIVSSPYNYWIGGNNKNANFIIDMGCTAKIIEVHLRNSHKGNTNNCGTKDWRLMISDKNNGPWTIIANGSFPDPRLTQWNVPLTVVTPTGYDIPAGQFVKFSCLTRWSSTSSERCALHYIGLTQA